MMGSGTRSVSLYHAKTVNHRIIQSTNGVKLYYHSLYVWLKCLIYIIIIVPYIHKIEIIKYESTSLI